MTGMIQEGHYRPGERLPNESALVSELGVSRTPLREAIRALVVLGILETRQGDGTYVTDLTASSLFKAVAYASDLQTTSNPEQLLSVRRALEVEAVGLAAQNAEREQVAQAAHTLDQMDLLAARPWDESTRERMVDLDITFHGQIAQMSGNAVLVALLDAFGMRAVRLRRRAVGDRDETNDRIQAQHRAILESIAQGNAQCAQVEMAAHLYELERYLRENPQPGQQGEPVRQGEGPLDR